MTFTKTGRMGAWMAVLAALTCALCLAAPLQAHAVVNLGTVGVAVPSSISIDSGQTGQVAVACDPAYSDQYPNCLNDYCPSGCDFGKEGDGVACEDKTGQCTCYGYKSARYYPSCTVASSNPSVVRASWSDGTLSVSGFKPGTATLTVTPSLRLFSSLPATIQVEVTAPPAPQAQETEAPSQQQPSAQELPSSQGKGNSGATASSGGSGGGSGSGSVTASAASASSNAGAVSVVTSSKKKSSGPGAAASAEGSAVASSTSRSGAGAVVSVIEQSDAGATGDAAGDSTQTDAGTLSSAGVHKLDGKTDVAAVLSKAAGTAEVVTLWGGDSAESPTFMLIISGANVPADLDSKLNLTVEETEDEQLAEQLGGIDYTSFTIGGVDKLPCTAQMFWRTTNAFENDAVVNVYQYDHMRGSFKKIHSNIKVGEGYACFNLIDGGAYVIAKRDDLDATTVAATDANSDAAASGASAVAEADEAAESDDADEAEGVEPVGTTAEDAATSGAGLPLKRIPPWTAPAGVAAAAFAAGVATYSVRRKALGKNLAADGGDLVD